MLIAKFSSQAHELMLQFCVRSVSSLVGRRLLRDVLPERLRAQSPVDPEGPWKRTSTFGECEAAGRGVKVRPTSVCGATWIGHDGQVSRAVRVRSCDNPQQLTPDGPLATSDTGPDDGARDHRPHSNASVEQTPNRRCATMGSWPTWTTTSTRPASTDPCGSRTTCPPGARVR